MTIDLQRACMLFNRQSSIISHQLSGGRFGAGGPGLAFATQRAYTAADSLPSLLKALAGGTSQIAGPLGDVVARFLTAHGGEQDAQADTHPQSKKKCLHCCLL